MKPREVERLRPAVGSRPASDTDDTMWEELLQGPDSASTGSSDSDGNGRFNTNITITQVMSPSSDDESLQQGITGVRSPMTFYIILFFIFPIYSQCFCLKKKKRMGKNYKILGNVYLWISNTCTWISEEIQLVLGVINVYVSDQILTHFYTPNNWMLFIVFDCSTSCHGCRHVTHLRTVSAL